MTRYLLGMIMLILLTGCARQHADFQVQLSLNYEMDNKTAPAQAAGAKSETSWQSHAGLNPFQQHVYQDAFLQWTVMASSSLVNFQITNLTAETITLHWEQAQLAAGQSQEWRALQSWSSVINDQMLGPKGYVQEPNARIHSLTPLILNAGTTGTLGFAGVYGDIFPSQSIFNIQNKEGEPLVTASKDLQPLLIKLPISMGEASGHIYLTLTPLAMQNRKVRHLF